MPLREPPQSAVVILVLDQNDVPAVLIDVERARAKAVALAVAFGRLDLPDTMQFVTRVGRVEELRRQQLRVLVATVAEPVAVVRDVQLALADQLPHIAVECAVVHVEHEIGRAWCRERVSQSREISEGADTYKKKTTQKR